MTQQYLRKCSLVVSNANVNLDLSALRIVFHVYQQDLQTPNHTNIRVYNLSASTAKKINDEFTSVTLQAGYENGNFGTAFQGTIIQVRRGREDQMNTYTDIIAADGDFPYNFGVVNTTLAGPSAVDQINATLKAMGVKTGYLPPLPDAKLSRGKVLFGMARDRLRDITTGTNTRWSLQGGTVNLTSLTDVNPGLEVVLNAQTGMIDLPEQTIDGIKVKSLLNTNYIVSGRVKIDNASIQRATVDPGIQGATQIFPQIDSDGNYKILVIEHEGDTRGNNWYSNLTCIGINDTAPAGLVVKGYG